MNYKITFCILHPAIGFEKKDGITIELPFVPQLNSCLILSQEHLRLLETKAFESENKKHYLSKWNDESGEEWRDRGRDDIDLEDYFWVQYVRYHTEDGKVKVVVVLNHTYETD
jgi:hypothetical protein